MTLLGPDGLPRVKEPEAGPKVWPVGEIRLPPIKGDIDYWLDLMLNVSPQHSAFTVICWIALSKAYQRFESKTEALDDDQSALWTKIGPLEARCAELEKRCALLEEKLRSST